jgi:hypothetical protein
VELSRYFFNGLRLKIVTKVGENGAEMLISAFKSKRRLSGPELAG